VANLTFSSLKYDDFVPFLLKKSSVGLVAPTCFGPPDGETLNPFFSRYSSRAFQQFQEYQNIL